jgi:hypothetical protein
VIKLEDGEEEMEREGGVGRDLFVEGEVDLLLAYADDLGAVKEAVRDDIVDLAGFGAEDAGEMDGLIAGESGGGGGPGVSDEAATGHAFESRAKSKYVYLALERKTKDEIQRSFTLFNVTDFKHKELSTSVLNRF